VELHMRRDVSVCSIGYVELMVSSPAEYWTTYAG
jgi:hypothetical protein